MICSIHPNALFCNDRVIRDEELKNDFLETLLGHYNMIRKFDVRIAWTEEFLSKFWSEKPWTYHMWDRFLKDIKYGMGKYWEFFDGPPDRICNIEPDIESTIEDTSIKNLWLILLHRILHKIEDCNIVDPNCESRNVEVSCSCSGITTKKFFVVNQIATWYFTVDYIHFWPKSRGDFIESLNLMIEIYYYQEISPKNLKTSKRDISYDGNFIKKLFGINDDSEKKAVAKAISKVVYLDFTEINKDNGLRLTKMKDSTNEYHFYVTRGSRIYCSIEENKILFTRYDRASEHR